MKAIFVSWSLLIKLCGIYANLIKQCSNEEKIKMLVQFSTSNTLLIYHYIGYFNYVNVVRDKAGNNSALCFTQFILPLAFFAKNDTREILANIRAWSYKTWTGPLDLFAFSKPLKKKNKLRMHFENINTNSNLN